MSLDKDARMKILEDTIANLEKTYGKGTIMKLGDGVINKVEAISTGSLSLDYALGIGGVPRGRIIEIFGPESSGKTTLCLHIIAEAQKKGGLAAFIDAEHALDLNYAKRLGVDTSNLLLSQPDFGEQALEIVDTLIRSNALDVIVIDSVAALVPRTEIEGDMGDPQMAVQARLMSQALRKITGAISKSKTCVIFTNQLRSKIGVMFGNPETTTGGNALKFYASVRLDIRRVNAIKDGNNVIGSRTKVKIVKSKVAPPFKEVEFDILYNEGISKAGDIIDLATEHGILKKSGAWFTYKDERFQGREQLKQRMLEDPKFFETLEKEVRSVLGMTNGETQESTTEPETKNKKTK
ncbi:recombinase RecA [Rosettibacter firmus]|uniref:recombinase RecA n=1 Tax=Rosettibacter firmus TaxID=3111522 RepID=UPI00336BB37F